MTKKSLQLLIILILILLVISGCGSISGDNKEFTYNLPGSVKSLDPQTAVSEAPQIVLTALFEGLCRLDNQGNAIEGVATEWTANNDNTSYTFKLRENAKWSDKTPVTAHDFLYGFQRALDPATKATNLDDILIIKNAADIHNGNANISDIGVSAVDDFTLVINLERPSENFPELTAGAKFMPCNKEFFASTSGRYGLGAKYLLTNGPFTFSSNYSWTNGDSIMVSKSATYIGAKSPKPAGITFYMTTSEKTSANPTESLVNGIVDVLPIALEKCDEAANAGCNIIAHSNGVTGLIFNTDSEALADISLRELFVKSIDRESITSLLTDSTLITGNIIPDGIRLDGNPYRALVGSDLYVKKDLSILENLPSILNEVEYDTVPSVTVICKDDELSRAIANKTIISWNASLGNYFNIMPLSENELKNKVLARDYQIALTTIYSSGRTPYSFLKAFESSGSLLSDPKFDELLHTVNKTTDDYKKLEEFLHNQYIFYPIKKEKTYIAVAPKVKNMTLTIGYVDFFNATK